VHGERVDSCCVVGVCLEEDGEFVNLQPQMDAKLSHNLLSISTFATLWS
jgi:hypothetical protein